MVSQVIVSPETRCKESAIMFLNEAFQKVIDENELEKMDLFDARFNVFTNIIK
jgi:hypothetical protein